MNTICNDPYIYTIDNFLTEKECKFMIKVSKDNLKLAGVSTMNNDKVLEPGKYKGRTNSSFWMIHDAYPETLKIAKIIAEKIGCNYKHFESFQVIHYNENEEYMMVSSNGDNNNYSGWGCSCLVNVAAQRLACLACLAARWPRCLVCSVVYRLSRLSG